MLRITRLLVLAGSLLVAATPASAADKETTRRVEALAERASAEYHRGAFEDAVATYLEAYQLAPASALLYNIALIYDHKLDEPTLAVDFYRRYVASPDVDPRAARRAMARIGELKASARRPLPERGSTTVETLDDGGGAQAVAGRQAEPPDGARRRWGWITLGAGGALLAGGAVTGILAKNDSDAFANAQTVSGKRELRDRGRALALSTDALLGVGVAAAATGAVLLLTGDDAGSTAQGRPRLGGAPLPGGAALVFGGRL